MESTKTINIIHNDQKLSIETAYSLKNKLISLGYTVSSTFDESAELTICIGGDGTFLRALRNHNFPKIPIVGINTGHLGFFTEITPKEIDDFLKKYMSNKYTLQQITPIEAEISTRNNKITTTGINEIVIKGDKSRTIHLDIYVNDNLVQRFSGDGILISTSPGSTAYNYSAGGSIVDPSLNVLQITPLSPMNTNVYRCFSSSIILPSDAIIKVKPEYRFENSLLVVSDSVEHRHNSIMQVNVSLSKYKINMVRLENYEFWSRVTSKFL